MTTAEYNLCVDEHADGVFRFILKNIKDEEKARDVVQDTFAKMWEKVHEVSHQKAKSYLFTAAYHTMIDRIRKDKRQTSFDEVSYDKASEEQPYSGAKEIIDEALEKLPGTQRSALLLRDYEGYSYKEISRHMNIPIGTVKSRIHLGKKQIRSVYEA